MTDTRGSVTGKRIILEIVQEMRDGLHPLLYSRVAPGLYCVYLHPEDFAQMEGLVPRIRAEAERALAEEVRRLNAPQEPSAFRWFVASDPSSPIEVPPGGWTIQIEPDRDSEVARGTFVILSKLTLPPLPQFEGGAATTKVFRTLVNGPVRTKTEQVIASPALSSAAFSSPALSGSSQSPQASPAPHTSAQLQAPSADIVSLPAFPPFVPSAQPPLPDVSAGERKTVDVRNAPTTRAGDRDAPVLAEIAVQDGRGARVFLMDKQDIKIGRGGQFRLVDLQLEGPVRISRVHARIRRDEQGRFFIKDLSEWGTTVNGQRIARGVIKEGDEVREIDVEAELPPRARIGLAEAVFLEFTAGARS